MPLKPMSPGGPCGRKKSVCVQWPRRGPSSFPTPWLTFGLSVKVTKFTIMKQVPVCRLRAVWCMSPVLLNYYNNPLLLLCPFFR